VGNDEPIIFNQCECTLCYDCEYSWILTEMEKISFYNKRTLRCASCELEYDIEDVL
jgi:hypothetical protein